MSNKKSEDNTKTADQFRCPLDQMTFGSKVDLDRHFRRVHNAEINLENIGQELANSLLDKHDVVLSVRAYLADRGYEASYTDDPYGITEELLATKDKNMFMVEAINDSPRKDADIIFAIGKLVKRMAKVGFWNYYGIAMPREYYKFLRDFEVAGLETLKVHLFLVDEYLGLKHLNPKQTIELVTDLKAGKVVNPDLMMTT